MTFLQYFNPFTNWRKFGVYISNGLYNHHQNDEVQIQHELIVYTRHEPSNGSRLALEIAA